jgi:hypothetical protein
MPPQTKNLTATQPKNPSKNNIVNERTSVPVNGSMNLVTYYPSLSLEQEAYLPRRGRLRDITMVLVILSSAFSAIADDSYVITRQVLKYGQALNLQQFGGPEIQVSVTSIRQTRIYAQVVDHTKVTPVARVRIDSVAAYSDHAEVRGSKQVVMVPKRFNVEVPLDRRESLPECDTKISQIYEVPDSGIRVYYVDRIQPANTYELAVFVPKDNSKQASDAFEPAATHLDSEKLEKWYITLQNEKYKLNQNDPAAVAAWKRDVQLYNEALKEAQRKKSK